MSQAIYAPGLDRIINSNTNAVYRPTNGAGGVFASYIQGVTPKYAKNAGSREILQRNSMARIYIRVDLAEIELFKQSIGDSHTRNQLVDRLIGDPANPRRRGETIVDTGYIDFVLQSVDIGFQEKLQVSETLADNFVAYYFGQAAPVWNFSGSLINSVQDDQHSNFLRLYLHILRGTKLAQRRKIVSIKFDSFIVAGSLSNFQSKLQAGMEVLTPFSFQLLVKQVRIVNFTQGWVPTRPNGRFSADPLAVAYDGRPTTDRAPRADRMRIPPDADEAPGDYEVRDERVNQTPPVSQNTTPAEITEDPYIRDANGNAIGQRRTSTTAPIVSQEPVASNPALAAISTPQTVDQVTTRNSYVRTATAERNRENVQSLLERLGQ
jgi:hypothetical protein